MQDEVGKCVTVWLRQLTNRLIQLTAALQLILSLCTKTTFSDTLCITRRSLPSYSQHITASQCHKCLTTYSPPAFRQLTITYTPTTTEYSVTVDNVCTLTSSTGKDIPQSKCDQRLLQTSQEIFETATDDVDVMHQRLQ